MSKKPTPKEPVSKEEADWRRSMAFNAEAARAGIFAAMLDIHETMTNQNVPQAAAARARSAAGAMPAAGRGAGESERGRGFQAGGRSMTVSHDGGRGSGAANPYRIERPALISFSGGRTSAYMLWHILDAYDGKLPDDVHVCFANTGKEREETLRFVHECGTRWSVRVRWLEFRQRTGAHHERFAEVGLNSAHRLGEPFEALIATKKMLPNPVMRFCTDELKIKVMRDFMRASGYDHWLNVVGLRHDEPTRVARSLGRNALGKERWRTVCPLDTAGVSNRDVRAFWKRQDFDLQLLPFEGNCDGCFLKARPKLFEVERTKPGTLQWWADKEAEKGSTFRSEYGYAEIIDACRRQPDMFLGAFDDDPDMDVECGTWCAGEAA